MLLSDENFSDQKNRRRLTPGFSFLTPSYIIRVANDKKSLGGRPGGQWIAVAAPDAPAGTFAR